ncbi:germin-like protein subfamily 1 member 17 isoform X1 [Silene latifolia]|uniref:germin-like protein subfamily 1 member 17 isoform X1 n=1 Tax=Silene latifolia TaxID=37657 RepID=UPI003D76ACDA
MGKNPSEYTILVITTICMAITMSLNFNEVDASDPPPLQDFCVGIEDPKSAVFVNGLICKNPKKVTTQDFLFKGFNETGDTNNLLHINATLIDVERLPSLNTQGVAIAHIDYGPFGLNTPHHHPRSSEIFAVLTGTLYAGFITSDYQLFSVVLNPGDLFVFPQGLLHFQYNLKKSKARAIAAFGSQHPGRVNSAQGLFGTKPAILDDVLTKAYQVDDEVIQKLRAQFSRSLNNEVHIGRSGNNFVKDV